MTTPAKPTYKLDAESVHALKRLQKRWKVPKSKILNRCVRIAEKNASAISARLDALDRLQATVRENEIDVAEWAAAVRTERWHTNPVPEDDAASGHQLSNTITGPAVS